MLRGNIYSLRSRKTYRPGRGAIAKTSYLLAIACALSACALLAYSLAPVFRISLQLPAFTTIGGIPVGGLSRASAQTRLESIFFAPLSLTYARDTFQLSPALVEFKIDFDATLAQIPPAKDVSFWGALLGRTQSTQPTSARLIASLSTPALEAFLADVASRYGTAPGSAAADATAMVTLLTGAGTSLDVPRAVSAINTALLSPTNRTAQLHALPSDTFRPHLSLLEAQIKQYLALQKFEGLLSFYLVDLQRNAKIHFNTLNGTALSTDPDIAFSGMSILKIPIMAEFYRQSNDDALPYELDLVEKSITQSSNWTTNLLIAWIGDQNTGNGLYRLNTTIAQLGMSGTFIGGAYDSTDAPGFRYTPANKRTDISTAPDAYMQTTPSDMGRLLEGIYNCSVGKPNLLNDTFPGAYSEVECTTMINYLASNKIAVLIQAGVPEGVRVSHKHGWADGEPIGDAGLVFTPGGDYALVYYIWVPGNTYWDENSRHMADISRAVYYFFNPIVQNP